MVSTMIERAEQAGIDPERILRALTLAPATLEALQERADAKPESP